jgi:microcompartment protein CcmL/EutN
MNKEVIKAGLIEMLNAAKANLVKYETSGDERAVVAGRGMVADFEKAIAELV